MCGEGRFWQTADTGLCAELSTASTLAQWPPATCCQPRIVILQQDWHQENVNKDFEAFFEYLATLTNIAIK